MFVQQLCSHRRRWAHALLLRRLDLSGQTQSERHLLWRICSQDLWKLASSRIIRVSQQAGQKLLVQCQSDQKDWKPRVKSIVLVQRSADLRPRKNKCSSQSPKAAKKAIPDWKLSGRQNFFLVRKQSDFWFYSVLSQIEWGPPTLEKAICLTQSTDTNINII